MEDRLRKLEVLIGTWHTTISMLDGEGREVGTSQALDIYIGGRQTAASFFTM